MIIDDLAIHIQSGKGGDGMVAFNGNKMGLGPTGAKGGHGGSIIFEGVSDIDALNRLRNKKLFRAEDGKKGHRQLNDGARGEDLIIQIPIGTIIHNLTTGLDEEITKIGQQIVSAKGGHGGKGNYHFRGPHNTSPKEFQPGLTGEEFDIRLELKLMADVGLIGLPNAGKSSFLNEFTNAKSKVANYPFTTLEPNLGDHYGLILADIPGLIEGASNGKGLGIKFLRHIERTNVLFHLVSAESEHIAEDYRATRKELGAYSEILLKKEEYVFLSKADAIDPTDLAKKLTALKKLNPNTSTLSILDHASLDHARTILNKIAKQNRSRKTTHAVDSCFRL